MDREKVEAFLAVAECGTFKDAAQRLFISQPALSYRIKSLEAELGLCLVDRSRGKREVELTPAGFKFLSAAEQFHTTFGYVDSIRESDAPTASLSIVWIDSIACTVFADFPLYIRERLPEVRLSFSTHWYNAAYRLVDDGSADVAVVTRNISRQGIVSLGLFNERFLALTSARNSCYDNVRRAEQLDPRKEIYLDFSSGFNAWHERVLGPTSQAQLTLDRVMAIGPVLDATDLWCFAPASVVPYIKSRAGLRVLEIDETPPRRATQIIRKTYSEFSESDLYQDFKTILCDYLHVKGKELPIDLFV